MFFACLFSISMSSVSSQFPGMNNTFCFLFVNGSSIVSSSSPIPAMSPASIVMSALFVCACFASLSAISLLPCRSPPARILRFFAIFL